MLHIAAGSQGGDGRIETADAAVISGVVFVIFNMYHITSMACEKKGKANTHSKRKIMFYSHVIPQRHPPLLWRDTIEQSYCDVINK
jgi:hypothetical protein